MRTGILILDEFVKRGSIKTGSSYYDRYMNVGIKVILDSLEANIPDFQFDHDEDYLTLSSADDFDVILISLNSWMDVYNLVYTFWLTGMKAEDFDATIIVGGIGFTNIKGFLDYADVFVFGAGEDTILDIWNQLETGKKKTELQSNEFWYVRGEDLEMKVLRTPDKLYQSHSGPVSFSFGAPPMDATQEAMGCPNKCLFCQYSWTRKYIDVDAGYDGDFVRTRDSHSEQTFKDLEIKDGVGKCLVGIDGFSERLRKAVRKNITDSDIVEKFVKIDQEQHGKIIVLRFYMICGYPSETHLDYAEFDSLLHQISEAIQYTKFAIEVHIQPFNPMALTPMGWEAARVLTDWRDYFLGSGNSNYLIEEPLLDCSIEWSLIAPLTHFMANLVERASVTDAKLIRFLVSNKRFRQFKASKQVEWLSRNHDGFQDIVREYEIGEPTAWDYIDGYMKRDKLINAAQKFRKETAPGYRWNKNLPLVC